MNRPFPFCLCFKTSHDAQPFIWKWVWFARQWTCKTHFHRKGCVPGLVLKQRQKATRKWPYLSLFRISQSSWKYPNCFRLLLSNRIVLQELTGAQKAFASALRHRDTSCCLETCHGTSGLSQSSKAGFRLDWLERNTQWSNQLDWHRSAFVKHVQEY